MPDATGRFRGISVPREPFYTTDDLKERLHLLVRQERRARARMEEATTLHDRVQSQIHEIQEQIDARRR